MGTGSFSGVKSDRGVRLTPYPLLVPWSRKGRAVPLLPLWAVQPVQSLSACTRVQFNFVYEKYNEYNSEFLCIFLYLPNHDSLTIFLRAVDLWPESQAETCYHKLCCISSNKTNLTITEFVSVEQQRTKLSGYIGHMTFVTWMTQNWRQDFFEFWSFRAQISTLIPTAIRLKFFLFSSVPLEI
jgi:hypothetical protein